MMSDATMILFLCMGILLLIGVTIYQQFMFRTGMQIKLREIHGKLKEIIDTDSDERIMVFTDNGELMELAAQMNRLLEERLKLKAEYRRSEMASKKMLSNISHDMKTPMTVVLGYLEIMRVNGAADCEMLMKTEQKAKSVMKLIDEFFTLAKIESDDMDIALSRVDLCEICREGVLDFYEILTKADLQVEIGLPKTPVYVMGNKEALQRILGNLISNVIRYGADGNYIGVFLREEEKIVCVDVVDKGQGIEKAFTERIFDRLFTMEDSRSRSVQGNGLGLTIARNLALKMGGEIAVNSVPRHRTVFTIRIKKAAF